jgi:hypothetical protein
MAGQLTQPMISQPLRVAVQDRTGDVVIWTPEAPTIRRGGPWISGAEAMRYLPDADELKDAWMILEGDEATALIAEAGLAPADPDDVVLDSLARGLRRAAEKRQGRADL